MNDNDIKDVLHERAVSVTPPTEMPVALKRRTHRRQGANLLGVAALVSAIAVGGFGAWRTLSPLGREGTKPAGPGPSTTSSSDLPIGDATIVASGDSVGGTWALTVKELDTGELDFSFVTDSAACCGGWTKAAPSGRGSVMASATSLFSEGDPPIGVAFLYGEVSSDISKITARLADGSSFDATFYPIPVGGPEWSQDQLYVITIPEAAYAHVSLYSFREDGTPLDDGNPLDITVGGLLVASGDSAFGPWELIDPMPVAGEAPLTNSTLRLFLAGNWYEVGRPLTDPGAGFIDPQALVLAHITGADKDGSYQLGTLVFGSVGWDVTSVEFREDGPDGSTMQAHIGDLLPTRGARRGFVLVTESDSGVIIARDASGNMLEEFALEPFVNAGDPANLRLVLAEGERAGTSWRLTIGGYPPEYSIDVFSANSGGFTVGSGPSLPGLITSQTIHESGLTLVYGSLPAGAASVRVSGDGTETTATIVRCPCGNLAGPTFDFFYAEFPPSEAIYHVTALAADGTVIDRPSIAEPSPKP